MKTGIVLFALALLAPLEAQAANAKLAPRFQEWLTGPPSLLITPEEREAFKNLEEDEQRDKFVERFWEVRNPAPGSGTNKFKEEFYSRLSFANTFYGKDSGREGWRTDRGRTYILFGKPQTSTSLPGNSEIYPVEMWFYANPGLRELPAFFYVLFFDRDGVSGFKLYHPYVDGPARLMRNNPTNAQAYQYLRNVNSEFARVTLSLIPGEPVDTESYTGSIASARILQAIQGFSEMRSYRALIIAKSTRLEQVKSKIEYRVATPRLLAYVARENGQPWLHWQFEITDAEHPHLAPGPVSYEIEARLLSQGKLVYERVDSPSFDLPQAAFDRIGKLPLLYENRMPLVEGKYELLVTATNKSTGRAYEGEREITVQTPPDRPWVSGVLVVRRHEPDTRQRPFQFGGIKFSPMATPTVMAQRGLPIFYQISLGAKRPEQLEIEYVVGDVGGQSRKSFSETLDTRIADANGTVSMAKTLPIAEFATGSYQVAVRIKDPETGKISGQSTSFLVAPEVNLAAPLAISPAQPATPEREAAVHYERALSWLAQGNENRAAQELHTAWDLTQNPALERLLKQMASSQGTQLRQQVQ